MKLPVFTPYGWAVRIAGAVLALVLLFFVLGKLGISWDPFGWSANQAARDKAGNIQGQHGKAASDAAAKAKADFDARQEGRDKLTQENRDDIQSQKDAGVDAGDTGRALGRSLCKRNPRDPSCA